MIISLFTLSTLLLGLVIAYFYLYFKNTYSYWKRRKVVGPKPTLFFGNLKDSALGKVYIPLEMYKIYEEYPNEKMVGVYNFTVPALLIRDLDILKKILIKDFDRFQDRGFSLDDEGLGRNLFHSEGHTWATLRRKFSPLFTSGKLNNMFHLVLDRADAFMEFVDKNIDEGKNPEIAGLLGKYTMEVIGSCAFGVNVNSFNDEENQYALMIDKTMETSLKRLVDLMVPGIFKKFGISFFPTAAVKFFNGLAKTVVKNREGKPKIRQDFMDLIVEMKEQGYVKGSTLKNVEEGDIEITDGLISAQAFVFFLGGYETSSTTMAFMLYELARHPEIQDRLIEEIDIVLAAHDGKLIYESLKKYTYLDNVICETLRKYPVGDPLTRMALVDYKIPDTDLTISKGTPIKISVQGIHYDPKYWPEPEKFDPDRYTPENSAKRHPMAWLGFGEGPRHCIGMRFAKVQMTVAMVSLLSKYRVSPNERTVKEIVLNPGRITPQIQGGLYLNIEKRWR